MSNWNKLCRACLIAKESFTYFFYNNVSPETYWFCTSIEIKEDESLPKALCDSCYELLTKLLDFKQTCIQSQNTLLCYNNLRSETSKLVPKLDEINKQADATKIGTNGIFPKLESDTEHLNDGITETDFHDDNISTNKKKSHKRIKSKSRLKKRLVKSNIKLKNPRKHFMYTCELCNKKFNYLERFEAHKLKHEGKIVSIQCKQCKKTFMTWSGLKRHNDSEHTLVNLETLKCSTCGKICKSQQTLKMHQKIHGERRLCICDVCGKGFTTVIILKAHLETHKENRERRYTCEHCGKKYFTNTILLSHVSRRHTGRRFICELCSYPFTDKYNLAKHLLIHDGKKLYQCDICDKSYATQYSLVEHKRIHSGERPYVCSYCPKRFLSKRRLTDHHRIHTGEKPHKCSVCEQGFAQRGTLKRHMKVHDRVVPVLN